MAPPAALKPSLFPGSGVRHGQERAAADSSFFPLLCVSVSLCEEQAEEKVLRFNVRGGERTQRRTFDDSL